MRCWSNLDSDKLIFGCEILLAISSLFKLWEAVVCYRKCFHYVLLDKYINNDFTDALIVVKYRQHL